MEKPEKHTVHKSLVLTPTIGGVSTITFMAEFMASIFFFNLFRISWITPVLILAIWGGLHPLLRSIEGEDPKALQLWLGWIITGQSYYPARSNISAKSGKAKRSIPKNL